MFQNDNTNNNPSLQSQINAKYPRVDKSFSDGEEISYLLHLPFDLCKFFQFCPPLMWVNLYNLCSLDLPLQTEDCSRDEKLVSFDK